MISRWSLAAPNAVGCPVRVLSQSEEKLPMKRVAACLSATRRTSLSAAIVVALASGLVTIPTWTRAQADAPDPEGLEARIAALEARVTKLEEDKDKPAIVKAPFVVMGKNGELLRVDEIEGGGVLRL